MRTSSRGPGTGRREGLALAVTAVSFAALVGAGFASYGDPDLAGRTTLARLSGEVASGVVAEWERLRRDPTLLTGETLVWSLEPGPRARPATRLQPSAEATVARALLGEARRIEREQGDARRALDVVLGALDKHPGAACRAEARLFAIQLSVRLEEPEVAAEQWALAREELDGDEVLDETSLLLLCALAAAPALPLEQRAQLHDQLVSSWVAGDLALPPASFEGSPLREAYRARLQALVPESAPDTRLERSALAERSRALAVLVGEPLVPPPDGGLVLQPLEGRELLERRRDAETVEGRLLSAGSVEGWIEAAVRDAELLPEGFSLDFEGDHEQAGAVVRERVPLAFGPRGFVLRHADPDSILSAVRERQALLRAAFFALALGVAGAGFSVFRALRRERHLAELKSTFVAGVSHELRTPVASILLMAENLTDGRVTGTETRERYHRLIRREAERLRRLVDDVLDFSRLERGKGLHLVFGDVKVAEFARELEDEMRARAADSGGELRFEAGELPEHLRADREALRRAIWNLVDNALRHSGTRDIELRLAGDGRGGLSIVVRDRGRGVPAARLEALFRPFERLEAREASAAAGTGLGLAIVREIAEGHAGRADARLPAGGGLAVELRIPAPPTEEPE